MNATISRRHFLGTLGAAAANAGGLPKLLAGEPAKDNIRLGMMLQGDSAADLGEKAKRIAAAGFRRVQVTFFFRPTAEELKALAQALSQLKLKTVAFGTYFNLFRPDNTGYMGSSRTTMRLVAAHAELSTAGSSSPGAEATRRSSPAAIRATTPPRPSPTCTAPSARSCCRSSSRSAGGWHWSRITRMSWARWKWPKIFAPFPADRIGLLLDPPNFISPDLYPRRDNEFAAPSASLATASRMVHLKDMKLNPTGRSVDLPGPGGGEMNYPLLVSEIRKLNRPLDCIIEHINPELAVMSKTEGLGREPILSTGESIK